MFVHFDVHLEYRGCACVSVYNSDGPELAPPDGYHRIVPTYPRMGAPVRYFLVRVHHRHVFRRLIWARAAVFVQRSQLRPSLLALGKDIPHEPRFVLFIFSSRQ